MKATLYRTDEGWVFGPVASQLSAEQIANALAAWTPGRPLVFDGPIEYIDARRTPTVELEPLVAAGGPAWYVTGFVGLAGLAVGYLIGLLA